MAQKINSSQITSNFMNATISANVTVTSSDSNMANAQKLNLNVVQLSNGDGFTVSGGGVVVGEGISYVEVSGTVYFHSPFEANQLHRTAIINDTKGEILQRTLDRGTAAYKSFPLSTTVAKVSPGDRLRLSVSCGVSGSLISTSDTHLFVRAIG